MPDVDRFQRTLRGPYWRRAYRLSISDENCEALRDTLTKACAAYLRDAFPLDRLKRCPQMIFEALRKKSSEQPIMDAPEIFLDLNRQLKQLDSEEHDFAAVEIMKTAAQTVFTDLESYNKSTTALDVEQAFSHQLIERIVRHCFLARVRDGIASERSLSAAQQLDWERKLVADVSARAEAMLKSFFRKRNGAIRAPKQLTPQRMMTMDELNTALPVTEV